MPLDGTNFEQQDEVLDLLRRALALLRKHGWCQREAVSGDGRICLFEAIRKAGSLRTVTDWDALGIPWPVGFNDAPGRTQAEVEAWLEEQIWLRVAQLQTTGELA